MTELPPVRQPRVIQPRVLSSFVDGFGLIHVIDEEGETVVPRSGGSTFGVNVDWSGGTAEIRWSYGDDGANNRSYVDVQLWCHTSGFTTYGTGTWNIRNGWDTNVSGQVSISGAWKHVATVGRWHGHDAAGALNIEVGVASGEVIGTSFDAVWGTQWHGLTNYVVLPFAPVNLRVAPNTVATTSFGVNYDRNTYDAPDRGDQVQWATDSNFNNVVWTDEGAAGYSNPAGLGVQLTPGTTHWVRVRTHTAAGWGPWSATISQATLPAVPPGFVVATSPSGTTATLTFSPPGGVSGVTKYTWERRLNGTTTPVATGDSTVVTTTVSDLVPGTIYDWRASAWIGTYQSPWTEWAPLMQAKPNTNPGDYFDGSSADLADLDYAWTGAPNASQSIATGRGLAGWEAGFSSGAGVMHQVTAGIFNTFAARVVVKADTSAATHLQAGQKKTAPYWTEVTPDATYIGSLHVRPSRPQRMVAEVVFMTAAGAYISSHYGAEVVVPGGAWMRLAAGGSAPAGAAFATVQALDTGGVDWSTWKSGDTLDLDGAMISLNEEFPYFDGDTLADGEFVYEWDAEPNASVSTRTPVAQVQAGQQVILPGGHAVSAGRALTDPDCAVVPSPPRPPSVPSDCIEDVGIWRRYYTVIPANLVPDWLDVVPTLDITSGSLAARQVRIRYYANPENLPPEQVNTSSWLSEQIISFMPASTVMTLDGVTQRVWAEVNDSAPISADHLLYGTNGKPANWPVLSCGIAYLVSIEVPITEPAGNISVGAALTARS